MISVGNSDIQAENVPFWKQVIDSATPLMDINGYLFKQQQQRHKRHHHQHKAPNDDGEAAQAAPAAQTAHVDMCLNMAVGQIETNDPSPEGEKQ